GYRGRGGWRDWFLQKTVYRGGVRDRLNSIFVEEDVRADLSDVSEIPRVGPRRSEPARQYSRDETGLAHRNQDRPLVLVRGCVHVEQRQTIGQAIRFRGNFDHFSAGRPHRVRPFWRITRHVCEFMGGQHDALAVGAGDEVVEASLPFDVDVFGALLKRLFQHSPALVFRSLEASTLPGSATGDDDGLFTPG